MKRFRSGSRRTPGARPTKSARSTTPVRPVDAALGRQTRGLVGPSRRSGGNRARAAARLRAGGRIVTPARAAALLGMLASGFLFSFVTGPTVFGLSRTEVPNLTWTQPQLVRDKLALVAGSNVFGLDTAPLEAALGTLPAVASADVSVSLPDAAVVVRIEERRPVLAWQVADRRFLVDREGVVFASVEAKAALPAGVAVVEDRRQGGANLLVIGGHIDAVDLDVATRLGSLTPADIGSRAARLAVAATESDGFVVIAPGAWTAVFGFYSPATRATDLIPGQVRLLRSLLDGREATASRIILASETDGTYVPVPTPKPTTR
jgi:hypothetical protein